MYVKGWAPAKTEEKCCSETSVNFDWDVHYPVIWRVPMSGVLINIPYIMRYVYCHTFVLGCLMARALQHRPRQKPDTLHVSRPLSAKECRVGPFRNKRCILLTDFCETWYEPHVTDEPPSSAVTPIWPQCGRLMVIGAVHSGIVIAVLVLLCYEPGN
jgi:hypothetical protein